jgi:hypothetical protein
MIDNNSNSDSKIKSPEASCSFRKAFFQKNKSKSESQTYDIKNKYGELTSSEKQQILQTKIECMWIIVSSAVKSAKEAEISAKDCWDHTPPVTP